MSAVAFIRRMLEAGFSHEDALRAAEAFEATVVEAASAGPTMTLRQARNRRHYERLKASEKRLNTSETSEQDGAPLPLPPSPQTPQPPTPTPGDISTPARKGPDLKAGFATFWSAYPKRKSKDTATKAFAKAMGRITEDDPLAVILAGIERALPGWDDPQFIPYPATWLNAAGWEDEAPQPRNTPPQRPRNERPDRYEQQQDNLAAAWTGSERAAEIVAGRRGFG